MNTNVFPIEKKSRIENIKNDIFTDTDYNSNMGFMTSIWGPPIWLFLHTISFNYPINPSQDDKKNYKIFISNLKYILPCKYCRINLKNNFKSLPLTYEKLKNRETFSRYIYDLHELINKMLNKKSNLTYEDVKNRYENFRARCSPDKLYDIKKEKGCTEPLIGKKAKCILSIVPINTKTDTFKISKKCLKKRKYNKTYKNK